MKRTISGFLTILGYMPGAMATPAVTLQTSFGSGSRLHYTVQETVILKKEGKRLSQIDSHQDTINIDDCSPSSCIYSISKDGTQLTVETTIAHDGSILKVDSANESSYNTGYALGALTKKFIIFHGVDFEPGNAKTCKARWGDKISLRIMSACNELMTASCKLIKIERKAGSDYVVIRYEQILKGVIGGIDAKSQGEVTFDRSTGILIKDEDRIIFDNLPPPIEALESSGTTQLDSQRSVIKDQPSTPREPEGQRP